MGNTNLSPFIPKFDFPPYVSFEIATSCSYSCIFCEADIPVSRLAQANNLALSFEQQMCVLKKLADAGTFRLFLTGGEPLSNPHFPELYSVATDLGMVALVSTNAFSIDSKMIDRLLKVGATNLQVSIQGVGDLHNEIVGVDGAYDVVMENICRMIHAGFEIEVACVGLAQNFSNIPDLVRAVGKEGVTFFRVLRYVPSHRTKMLDYVPSHEILETVIPNIYLAGEEVGIKVMVGTCPGYYGDSSRKTYDIVHPLAHFCSAGKVQMSILADGRVLPCLALRNNPELVAGNIIYDPMESLWNHKSMLKFRKLTPADYENKCADCNNKWICYSARCVSYNLTGSLYGDDYSCYKIRTG